MLLGVASVGMVMDDQNYLPHSTRAVSVYEVQPDPTVIREWRMIEFWRD